MSSIRCIFQKTPGKPFLTFMILVTVLLGTWQTVPAWDRWTLPAGKLLVNDAEPIFEPSIGPQAIDFRPGAKPVADPLPPVPARPQPESSDPALAIPEGDLVFPQEFMPSLYVNLAHMDERGTVEIAPDSSTVGAFHFEGDIDRFSVELERDGILTLYTVSESATHGILRDSTGVVVGESKGFCEDFFMEVRLPTGGYTLELSKARCISLPQVEEGYSRPEHLKQGETPRIFGYTLVAEFLEKPRQRALVVLMENGGLTLDLPEFTVPICDFSRVDLLNPLTWGNVTCRDVDILEVVAQEFQEVSDSVIEGVAGSAVRAAAGARYDEVVILEDEDFSMETVIATLRNLAPFYVIDLHILAHGHSGYFVGHAGTQFFSYEALYRELDDYLRDDPNQAYASARDFINEFIGPDSAYHVYDDIYDYFNTAWTGYQAVGFFDQLRGIPDLFIGAVYQQNCYGSSLLAAWREAGAETVNGSLEINYMPGSYSHFLALWLDGETFGEAVQRSYDDLAPMHGFLYRFIDLYDEADENAERNPPETDIFGGLSPEDELASSMMLLAGHEGTSIDDDL